MTPIGEGTISLTKHYRLDELVGELAQIKPGSTEAEARTIFGAGGHAHAELADDLFIFDDSERIEDDAMLQACRASADSAPLLVWVALLLADPRLARVVEEFLTTKSGRLDPAEFDVEQLRDSLGSLIDTETGKAASNILRYFETAGIIEARKRGASIVGIERTLPTAPAVPDVVRYLEQRLRAIGLRPGPASDSVGLALALGANHWLNLTPAEFRAAARGIAAAARKERAELPADLALFHDELARNGQVILQGPPGSGKTFTARRYARWLTAGSLQESRITELLALLPEAERTPERVAELLRASGAPAGWDIVQFHPSYTYEDFVRGLQAEPVTGGVTFNARNKTLGFMAALAELLDDQDDDIELLLIIDEINRSDISKVFGELIYALEYRDQPVTTPYAVDGSMSLSLPRRLRFIGTMNTADRSIAVVDYALRRRFVFLDVRPDSEVITSADGFVGSSDRDAAVRLFDEVEKLFASGDRELRELQVGHSYFLLRGDHGDEAAGVALLARRFAFEVYPLLLEYEAEGRIEPESLQELLARVGHSGDGRPEQEELAALVAAFLEGPAD